MAFNIATHLQKIEDIVSSCTLETCGSESFSVEEVLEVLNEQSRMLKGLEANAAKLQADCKATKEKYAALDKEKSKFKKELAKLKEEDASLTKKLNKYKSDITECKHKISVAKRKVGISKKEEELLSKNENELNTFKSLTGLRWNFDCGKDVKEGLMTNSKKNYVKVFSIKSTLPTKEISETLWTYLKESSTESWDLHDEDKENRNDNK